MGAWKEIEVNPQRYLVQTASKKGNSAMEKFLAKAVPYSWAEQEERMGLSL